MSKKSDIHSQRAKKISEKLSKSLKYPIDHKKAKENAEKKAEEKAKSAIPLAAMHHDAGRPALPNSYDTKYIDEL